MLLTGVRVVSTGNSTPLQDTGRIETGQINRKSDTISVVVRLIPESKSSVRPTDFISLTRSLTTLLPLTFLLLLQGCDSEVSIPISTRIEGTGKTL